MLTAYLVARSFDDAQRIALATQEKDRTLGPLEVAGCPHGRHYSFRYEWPRGSGPSHGECVVLDNACAECACEPCLQNGSRRPG